MISHQMGMLVHFSLHLDSLNRFLLVRVNHSVVLVNHLFYYRFANWYIRVENYIDQSTKNGLPTKWTDLVTIILPICVCMCAAHQISHAHVHVCHVHGCSRFKRNLISLFVYAEGIFCCFIYDCFEYCWSYQCGIV